MNGSIPVRIIEKMLSYKFWAWYFFFFVFCYHEFFVEGWKLLEVAWRVDKKQCLTRWRVHTAQRFKPIDEFTVNDLLRKKKMTPCPLFDLCYCIAISSLKVFKKTWINDNKIQILGQHIFTNTCEITKESNFSLGVAGISILSQTGQNHTSAVRFDLALSKTRQEFSPAALVLTSWCLRQYGVRYSVFGTTLQQFCNNLYYFLHI